MALILVIPVVFFLCWLGIMMRNEAKAVKRNEAATNPMFSKKRRY